MVGSNTNSANQEMAHIKGQSAIDKKTIGDLRSDPEKVQREGRDRTKTLQQTREQEKLQPRYSGVCIYIVENQAPYYPSFV
jgi:hypothetical protein